MAIKVTVEPAILLFMFTVYLWYPLCTELIYENILGSENKECEKNDTVCAEKKKSTQEEVTRLQLYIAASRHIPAFFSALIMGSFSDRYGRRPVMVLSCIGNGIWTAVMLFHVYFKFSVYYFVVGGVIDGMCGGIGAFLFSSFAYVADTSTEEERTKKISLSESMICLGGFVASITGGLWSDKRGFAAPLFTVLLCNALIIIYVVVRLKEPRKVSRVKSYKFSDHIKRTFHLLLTPDASRKSLMLSLTIFSILIAVLAGTNNIFILFLLDKPFDWSKTSIGYFLAFNTLLNGLVTLLALPEFNKHFGDYWTALTGIIAACISSIIAGVSTDDWMLFLGSTVGAVGSLAIPTLRSEMSKMVSPSFQGSLFALMSASDVLVVLVSSSVMSKIYEETHSYYHGFCFLIEAGLAFLAIGLLIAQRIIKVMLKRIHDREQLIDELNDENNNEDLIRPVYVMTDLDDEESLQLNDIRPRLDSALLTDESTPRSPTMIPHPSNIISPKLELLVPLTSHDDPNTKESMNSQSHTANSQQLLAVDYDLNMIDKTSSSVLSFENPAVDLSGFGACGHVTCSFNKHKEIPSSEI